MDEISINQKAADSSKKPATDKTVQKPVDDKTVVKTPISTEKKVQSSAQKESSIKKAASKYIEDDWDKQCEDDYMDDIQEHIKCCRDAIEEAKSPVI